MVPETINVKVEEKKYETKLRMSLRMNLVEIKTNLE